MKLRFEEIAEADVPELTPVMTRAFDDDAKKHLGVEKGGPEGYDDGGFFRTWLFGQKWTVGYKAISDDRIVGAVIVWIFDSGKNHLGTIFVDPDCQNLGVGVRFWEFIESTYPDTKIWQLETPSFAVKNHHFYEKCGFRKAEVKPAEGDMPGESWVYRKEMDSNIGTGM
ncbi:MAG: GNAT family N-acetyltransferase [Planctomycetota bacterium]|jgi:GNAT superfamily N-acetyltransferase